MYFFSESFVFQGAMAKLSIVKYKLLLVLYEKGPRFEFWDARLIFVSIIVTFHFGAQRYNYQ